MSELIRSHSVPVERVYQQGELVITVEQALDPQGVALLQRSVYGTNGVRYQHAHPEQKARSLRHPLFFHLWKADQLIGLYCLDGRAVELRETSVTGFYGRYLAVDEIHSGQGYGRLLKQTAVAYAKRHTPAPHLFYAYIEERNARSMAISQREGFEPIAALKTFIFRRYAPRLDSRLAVASVEELTSMLPRLHEFYKGYTLKTFAHIGYQGNYFVLKEGNEILAGIQANPVSWRFLAMPGKDGWLLMRLAPLVSPTRRFFNPAHYAFLVLEGLYLQAGRGDLLPVLLESVLAYFHLHSAMWQIDERDPILILLKTKAMGPLSGFKKDVRTQVMVKAVGLTLEQVDAPNPVYVSCFDYS